MALTELVNALRQQAIKQREREGELLNNIAYLADLETAEAAAAENTESGFRSIRHSSPTPFSGVSSEALSSPSRP